MVGDYFYALEDEGVYGDVDRDLASRVERVARENDLHGFERVDDNTFTVSQYQGTRPLYQVTLTPRKLPTVAEFDRVFWSLVAEYGQYEEVYSDDDEIIHDIHDSLIDRFDGWTEEMRSTPYYLTDLLAYRAYLERVPDKVISVERLPEPVDPVKRFAEAVEYMFEQMNEPGVDRWERYTDKAYDFYLQNKEAFTTTYGRRWWHKNEFKDWVKAVKEWPILPVSRELGIRRLYVFAQAWTVYPFLYSLRSDLIAKYGNDGPVEDTAAWTAIREWINGLYDEAWKSLSDEPTPMIETKKPVIGFNVDAERKASWRDALSGGLFTLENVKIMDPTTGDVRPIEWKLTFDFKRAEQEIGNALIEESRTDDAAIVKAYEAVRRTVEAIHTAYGETGAAEQFALALQRIHGERNPGKLFNETDTAHDAFVWLPLFRNARTGVFAPTSISPEDRKDLIAFYQMIADAVREMPRGNSAIAELQTKHGYDINVATTNTFAEDLANWLDGLIEAARPERKDVNAFDELLVAGKTILDAMQNAIADYGHYEQRYIDWFAKARAHALTWDVNTLVPDTSIDYIRSRYVSDGGLVARKTVIRFWQYVHDHCDEIVTDAGALNAYIRKIDSRMPCEALNVSNFQSWFGPILNAAKTEIE